MCYYIQYLFNQIKKWKDKQYSSYLTTNWNEHRLNVYTFRSITPIPTPQKIKAYLNVRDIFKGFLLIVGNERLREKCEWIHTSFNWAFLNSTAYYEWRQHCFSMLLHSIAWSSEKQYIHSLENLSLWHRVTKSLYLPGITQLQRLKLLILKPIKCSYHHKVTPPICIYTFNLRMYH